MAFFEKQNPVEVQINKQISDNLEFINNKYVDIGRYVKLNLGDKIEDPQIRGMLTEIDNALKNLQQLNEQLRYCKGIKVCPNCRSEIDLNVLFCPFCGTKQNIPQGGYVPQSGFSAKQNGFVPQQAQFVQPNNDFSAQQQDAALPNTNNMESFGFNQPSSRSEEAVILDNACDISLQDEENISETQSVEAFEEIKDTVLETVLPEESEKLKESNNNLQDFEDKDTMEHLDDDNLKSETINAVSVNAEASEEISRDFYAKEKTDALANDNFQKSSFIFCSQCGSKQESDSKFCSNCGSVL